MPPKTKRRKKLQELLDQKSSLSLLRSSVPRNDLGMLWPRTLIADFKVHAFMQIQHQSASPDYYFAGSNYYQNFVSFQGCWNSGNGCIFMTNGQYYTQLPLWTDASATGLSKPSEVFPHGLDTLVGAGLPYARCLVLRARGKINISTFYNVAGHFLPFNGPWVHYYRASSVSSIIGVDGTGNNAVTTAKQLDTFLCQKGVKHKYVHRGHFGGTASVDAVGVPGNVCTWKFDEYPHKLVKSSLGSYLSHRPTAGNQGPWHTDSSPLGPSFATGILFGGRQVNYVNADASGLFRLSMTMTMMLDSQSGSVT